MKTAAEVRPNYGPVYAACCYPDLAQICLNHGYALAVHGSLKRDFDVIAIPWTENPSEPQTVLDAIAAEFHVTRISEPAQKPHGRVAWCIHIEHGHCYFDISFMPVVTG
jgi:hypothetical protein